MKTNTICFLNLNEKNVKLIKKSLLKCDIVCEIKTWMCWYHGNMPLLFNLKKKKQQWPRYGDTEQNDSGNTITAQAKDKRTSLSTVDCMDESWCVSSYLITVEMNKWAL